jgi:very-short-patch-repair endonuclease
MENKKTKQRGQRKGFRHSEETKRIISEHSKRCWKEKEYVKKINYMKKLRREKLGYINSPETRKKLSKIMKDKIKSGEFNPRDISPFVKGHKTGMTGKKQSEYQKMIVRKKLKETRKNQIFPKEDTKIEVKIQNFLKKLGIEFFTHQYMKINHGYLCDILIPSMNLVIECDGDYWHKYPVGNEIDHIRTNELIEKGFKVLRLWENEIKLMNVSDFKQKIGEIN